jgi:hypothetical protein
MKFPFRRSPFAGFGRQTPAIAIYSLPLPPITARAPSGKRRGDATL